MFEFSVSKDVIREVAVRKVATHLCLTLIFKELEISVEHDRVVTTLNIIKYEISYFVYWCKDSMIKLTCTCLALVLSNEMEEPTVSY